MRRRHVERCQMRALGTLVVTGTLGLGAATASAQIKPAIEIRPPVVGDCVVILVPKALESGSIVDLELDYGYLPRHRVVDPSRNIEFPVRIPLQKGNRLRALVNGVAVQPDLLVGATPPADRKPEGTCDGGDEDEDEERETSFAAEAYLGGIVDTFAPDAVGNYQNPEAGARKTRMTFGIDFDGRLYGKDNDRVQFWVFAETLYGVRSADIDCSGQDKPPVCSDDPSAKALYILEHATSLEAFINPRLQFLRLQTHSESPVVLYVTGRLGFIALDGAPSVFKNHEVGAGFLLDGGPFQGSYLDFGWGKNELIADARWNRLKIDGTLVFSLERLLKNGATGFFIRLRVDNDLRGESADSIQTSYGMSFDLGGLFAP
ncbi:MAG TPA: hypothetical protein VFO58_07570 [Vicinamibacterales bacterium]|nr:hypothetical protein [Vicinamibacterales bacterium]